MSIQSTCIKRYKVTMVAFVLLVLHSAFSNVYSNSPSPRGCKITLHYWLRWSIGFWNVQKVGKSRQLFLIQKTHQVIFAACFELFMTHILRRKKSDDVDRAFLTKITANVQKRLKSVSFGADFLYDENIDHTDKKSSK